MKFAEASDKLYLLLTVLSYIQSSIISVNSSPLNSFSKSYSQESQVLTKIETSLPFAIKSSKYFCSWSPKAPILDSTAFINMLATTSFLGLLLPVEEAIRLPVYESKASRVNDTDFPLSPLLTFHHICTIISAFALFLSTSNGLSFSEAELDLLIVILSSAALCSTSFNSCSASFNGNPLSTINPPILLITCPNSVSS